MTISRNARQLRIDTMTGKFEFINKAGDRLFEAYLDDDILIVRAIPHTPRLSEGLFIEPYCSNTIRICRHPAKKYPNFKKLF